MKKNIALFVISTLAAICVSCPCRGTFSADDKKNTNDILREKEPLLNLSEKWEWIDPLRQNIDTSHILGYGYKIPANNFVSDFLIRMPGMPGIYHKVQKEDTVSRLSELYHVPADIIMEANNIENDYINKDYLFIPNPLLNKNYADTRLLKESFIFPLQGDITSPFGWYFDFDTYLFRPGVVIKAKPRSPVKAAMSGIIRDMGISFIHGKYVIIEHPSRFFTVYGRLSEVKTKEGHEIKQGGIIGEIAENSDRSYLFFGIFKNNYSLNPAVVITGPVHGKWK